MAENTQTRDDASKALISAVGLSVRFGDRQVLDHVDLAVAPGEIVTLIGPNGSGKTTLVRALLGIVGTATGTVHRQKGLTIGYAPQRLQVDQALPLTVRRFLGLSARQPEDRLRETLAEVGAGGVLEAPFQSLSGGEAKRVVLARALLRQPDLLVLDEPMANVDIAGQAALYDLIVRIRDARQCGVLMVSHDLHLVMATTDRVVCLNGHVCCSGHPEQVSRDPEYLALFGPTLAARLALYSHDHDHHHDLSGGAVPDDHEDHGAEGGPGHG